MGVGVYHALNRGVDKRQTFMCEIDYVRFVHDLYEFNDVHPATNTWYEFKNSDVRHPYIVRERQPIVQIHAWSLMENHYHLLLSEIREGGITSFLRKINTGYTNYFNDKYERSGVLFQGKTKKILIHEEAHFLHMPHYIHLNPLDYLEGASDWRSYALEDPVAALEYLSTYRWSSYLDYCNMDNFPSIIEKGLYSDIFPDYAPTIKSYLQSLDRPSIDLEPVTLE